MHKLWPRLSALGERLWSDPETDWKQAEIRQGRGNPPSVLRITVTIVLPPEVAFLKKKIWKEKLL